MARWTGRLLPLASPISTRMKMYIYSHDVSTISSACMRVGPATAMCSPDARVDEMARATAVGGEAPGQLWVTFWRQAPGIDTRQRQAPEPETAGHRGRRCSRPVAEPSRHGCTIRRSRCARTPEHIPWNGPIRPDERPDVSGSTDQKSSATSSVLVSPRTGGRIDDHDRRQTARR